MRPPRAKRAYFRTASATLISVSAAASGVSVPVAADGSSNAAAGRPQFSARPISATTALPLSVRPLVEPRSAVPVISLVVGGERGGLFFTRSSCRARAASCECRRRWDRPAARLAPGRAPGWIGQCRGGLGAARAPPVACGSGRVSPERAAGGAAAAVRSRRGSRCVAAVPRGGPGSGGVGAGWPRAEQAVAAGVAPVAAGVAAAGVVAGVAGAAGVAVAGAVAGAAGARRGQLCARILDLGLRREAMAASPPAGHLGRPSRRGVVAGGGSRRCATSEPVTQSAAIAGRSPTRARTAVFLIIPQSPKAPAS